MQFSCCSSVALVTAVVAGLVPPPGDDGSYTLSAPGIKAKVSSV